MSLLDEETAAQQLGISPEHIRRLCLFGRMTYRKQGKRYFFTKEDIAQARWEVGNKLPPTKPLSPRYVRVFRYIETYKLQCDGNSPTLREIMSNCDIPSTSQVHYALKMLERHGLVEILPGSRGIVVVGGKWVSPLSKPAQEA